VHWELFWKHSAQEPIECRDNELLCFSVPSVDEPEASVSGVEGMVF